MTFVPVTPGKISRSWRMVLSSPVLLFATSSSSPDPWREHLLYCFRAALVGSGVGEELTSFPDFLFRTFTAAYFCSRLAYFTRSFTAAYLPAISKMMVLRIIVKQGVFWEKWFAEFWKWDETNPNLQPRVSSFVKIKEKLLHKIVVQWFWMEIGNWKDFLVRWENQIWSPLDDRAILSS